MNFSKTVREDGGLETRKIMPSAKYHLTSIVDYCILRNKNHQKKVREAIQTSHILIP
jgi:hypothetical protein